MLPLALVSAFALWTWIVDTRRRLDARAADLASVPDPRPGAELTNEQIRAINARRVRELASAFGEACDAARADDPWSIWDRFMGRRQRDLLADQPDLLAWLAMRPGTSVHTPAGDPSTDPDGARRMGAELAARNHAIRELRACVARWVSRCSEGRRTPHWVPMDREWLSIARALAAFGNEGAALGRLERVERALVGGNLSGGDLEVHQQLHVEKSRKIGWADVIAAYLLGPDAGLDAHGVGRVCGTR